MIGVGVHIYISRLPQKKFEWHFSGQLTFSNTHSRFLVEFID